MTAHTKDDALRAAYAIVRDASPARPELALREEARRFVEKVGPDGAVRASLNLRARYVDAASREILAERKTERERLTEQRKAGIVRRDGEQQIEHMAALSRVVGQLQRERPELFVTSPAAVRDEAIERVARERPWIVADLRNHAHETSIGQTGRTTPTAKPRAKPPAAPPRSSRAPLHAMRPDAATSLLRSAGASETMPGDPAAEKRIARELVSE